MGKILFILLDLERGGGLEEDHIYPHHILSILQIYSYGVFHLMQDGKGAYDWFFSNIDFL